VYIAGSRVAFQVVFLTSYKLFMLKVKWAIPACAPEVTYRMYLGQWVVLILGKDLVVLALGMLQVDCYDSCRALF
jgi:hypothetical protein